MSVPRSRPTSEGRSAGTSLPSPQATWPGCRQSRTSESGALAGHELMSVVSNIADQARTMLECAGTVCWAFDTEGRISATRGSGDPTAEGVLAWAGLNSQDNWRDAPRGLAAGVT